MSVTRPRCSSRLAALRLKDASHEPARHGDRDWSWRLGGDRPTVLALGNSHTHKGIVVALESAFLRLSQPQHRFASGSYPDLFSETVVPPYKTRRKLRAHIVVESARHYSRKPARLNRFSSQLQNPKSSTNVPARSFGAPGAAPAGRTPMPISLLPGSRMFARWPGLFIHHPTAAAGVLPLPEPQ